MRTLEDRSRRNNICVKCIPGSENEGWYVMKEKLRKFFKDELDVENVVIEQVHEVKWNNYNNDNDDQIGNHQQLLLTYYISKTNKISCMKQNHVKLEIFILKKIFQEKLY